MAKIDVNRAIHRARSATLVFAVAVLATLTFTANASQALAKRVALVIGNSVYENASTLANPANDATDMAAALRDLNFEVVVGTDLDNRGMRDTVREFGQALRGADVAMVFYAGHAMQVNGKNYLAPVDTRLEYESDLDFETIPLSFIQRQMEREAKTILLFLDACRNNPLTRSFKQASRSQGAGDGLAEEKLTSSGILIAFATNPDNVALDGKGRNSPFTKAILDNIKRPGIEISTLMTDVRVQVVNDTDGAQTPWINSALLDRFYFNPAAENATPAKAVEGESGAPAVSSNGNGNSSAGVDNARIAALAWDSVKESKSVAELEAYKSLYGSTFYGTLADIRINNLKAEQKKSTPAATAEKAPEAGNEAPAKEIEVASLQQEKDTEVSRKLEPARDPREVARDIQAALAAFNCNPGRPDGIWGRRSQRALDAFVRASGVKLASVNPDEAMLRQLQDHDGAACPKPAVVKQKTCPAGQRLSRKGNCFTPRQQANVQPQPQQTRAINRQPQPQPRQQVIIQQQQPQPQPRQQVIIQQPQPQPQPHQQVIVQPQPQPHVVQQPRQPGLLPAIGGAILGCIVGAC